MPPTSAKVRMLRGSSRYDRELHQTHYLEVGKEYEVELGLAFALVSSNKAELVDPVAAGVVGVEEAPKVEAATAEAPERAARAGRAGR